jgi:CRP-like cAMP-binding protein
VTDRGVVEADAAIVTLPLGVLKAGAVTFDPPLPPAKIDAIQRVGMGSLTKIIAWFDEPFWDRSQYVFGSHRDHVIDGYPTTVLNLWATHRLPVLAMVIGGVKAREIERWPADQIQQWTTGVLGTIFGAAAAAPSRVAVTRWNTDPYARGAYAYMTHGASPADLDALADPVGDTLCFAGEHTSRQHWGCAHGAYTSGLREAARLVGDPSIVPPRHFTENRRWRDMMLRASRFFNLVSRSIETDEMTRRLEVLKASEVFSLVPENEMKVLASMFQVATFEDGAMICRQGDVANRAYLIVSGAIEVLRDDRAIARMERGGVFGEYGMLADAVRTATVIARGPTELLALDYQRFRSFLLAFPESMLALMKITVDRLLHQSQATSGSTDGSRT